MNNYPGERNASVIFIENTKLLWHWLENIQNIMCPGPPRGGAGEDNDPGGPWTLGGHGFQEGRWLQWGQQRAHELEREPIEMTLRS